MAAGLGWKLHGDGGAPPPGEVVGPDERLSWGLTVGLGAQHVVAMFGATFVFPVLMGLNPNLAILMSGIATICFLLIVRGQVPSYLGTSASFVGAVAAIRAQGGSSSDVTGAILVTGAVLALIGLLVHFGGARFVTAVLPPAVTGAVVMLIGFNLASVVATVYWPQDQWTALFTMVVVIAAAVLGRGIVSRLSVVIGLVVGFLLSKVLDLVFGPITSGAAGSKPVPHYRVSFGAVEQAPWIGLPSATRSATGALIPGPHLPTFHLAFVLLVLPIVIALVAENTGHVKAVAAMTGNDLDPYLGRALAADGVGTVLASAVGGSPTTTYAENIGVMAATRVYSTAAYYVAALVAIVFGFCPKFGALVSATPAGVLGGITVVLYGMIGLLGAKIWVESRVDFAAPLNLVPLAAGIIVGVGGVALQLTADFSLSGIALGTLVTIVGYHAVRRLAPMRQDAGGGAAIVTDGDQALPDRPRG